MNDLPFPTQNHHQQQQQQPAASQQPAQSQVSSNDTSQDVQMATPPNGLAPIQDQGFDFAALDVNGPGWNSGIDMNFANNPSVFAVVDVPAGPALDELDSSALSGKGSVVPSLPLYSTTTTKDDVPSIELPSAVTMDAKSQPTVPLVDIDEADRPAPSDQQQPTTTHRDSTSADLFEDRRSADPSVRLHNADEEKPPDDVTDATKARFERLCTSIEDPYRRVGRATSHLE